MSPSHGTLIRISGWISASILLLCFILPWPAQAQGMSWNFTGVNVFGAGELGRALQLVGFSADSPVARADVERVLQERYAQEGYYLVTVDSITVPFPGDIGPDGRIVHVTENDRAVVREIRFSGNARFSDEALLREMELYRGAPFAPPLLRQDIEAILSLYDRTGYPFARLSVTEISPLDSVGLVLELRIEEREIFIIGEMTVEGSTVTDPEVVLREARISPGEAFNVETLDDIRRRVEKLGFFSSVGDPQLYRRGKIGGLRIPVTEGNTNVFDGVVGYQPGRTSSESGTLTGLVRLSFRNLFGTGRRFDARWERASASIQELELRYMEPWLFGYPINLEGGFYQRQQDSTYVSRAVDLKFSLLATDAVQVNLLGKSLSVIPSAGAAGAAVNRGLTLSTGLELIVDTRDNMYAPRSGMLFRSGFAGGSKSFTSVAGERVASYIQNLSVDFALFHTLFRNTVAAAAVHGREVRGSELDIADYYRTGGANSLRGYREEQFSGTRIAYANLEYRYLLTRRTFAFAFFDYGYIFAPAIESRGIGEFVAWRKGYGLGIRLETGLGLMGVSYALGDGDSITAGKIHFGLINEF